MTVMHERPRVVLPKDWSFDLDQDMVDRIGNECDPDDVVAEVAAKAAGKPLDEAQKIAEGIFAAYGERWMNLTLELGDQYRDRAYETLLAAAKQTGELAFPLIPERFMEIAYLSTQPLYSLPIVENTRHKFSYRMVFCDTISRLREKCGDELADRLPCSQGCLTAARRAFEAHGFDVDVTQTASLAKDEYCQFTVRRR
jgi:hypothetical protein